MKWRRRPKSGTSADGAEPEPSPTHGTGPADEDPDADLKQRVGALFSQAQILMFEGLPAEAVPLQQQARRLSYLLLDRNPDDRESRRMLGSLLYGLGSTLAGPPGTHTRDPSGTHTQDPPGAHAQDPPGTYTQGPPGTYVHRTPLPGT
ncbi:hypothetical protein PV755_02500 [Streptomyces caniscabiei]|uniref:Uncharacterized protein n=1 Tax=Streptomyces caniscabiei TaxID=2746961 RepID=A0A927QG56_9ACTN|nr:hypothetical protein [Streptomyces caniscabiei]MBD9724395.1 hypothetical protein [Streptomyces caniscabiei]MDX3507803.1 hypothetical protein [Streptomyces caniscabiei]MDX3717765.1 hypothetical protein [Streptomyces caniscabiei]WEO25502.1 hypothetical protein IHE65_21240 [Streptomyces caniscabiei]